MFFSLKVQMQNGEVYEANIKDIDKKSDIATIKINPQVSEPALCPHLVQKASGQLITVVVN